MQEDLREVEHAVANDSAALHIVPAEALGCHELVAEFDRMAGTNVAGRGSPIEIAVDTASGRTAANLMLFSAFVKDVIWERLDEATRDALRAQAAKREQA